MDRDPHPAAPPPEVADLLLWRAARRLARRHGPDPTDPTRCADPDCLARRPYPCGPARIAAEAARQARGCAPEPGPARCRRDRAPARGRHTPESLPGPTSLPGLSPLSGPTPLPGPAPLVPLGGPPWR